MNSKKAIAWFIIIIMSLSVLGFVGGGLLGLGDSTNKKEYNNYAFYYNSGIWDLVYKTKKYQFQYLPNELENISIPDTTFLLNSPKLYLAYVPNDTIQSDQTILRIRTIMAEEISIVPQIACIKESGCPDIPIISCADSSGILIKSGENNGFQTQDKCLVMSVKDYSEQDRLTERLLYKLLGVMN